MYNLTAYCVPQNGDGSGKLFFVQREKLAASSKGEKSLLGQLLFCWVGQECRKSFCDGRNGKKLRQLNERQLAPNLNRYLINQITPPIRCLANCRTQKVTMKFIHKFDQFGVFAEVGRNRIRKCQQVGINLIKKIYQNWDFMLTHRSSYWFSINSKKKRID